MSKAKAPLLRPVRGSSTGRPIMVLLDLMGRRWMLRIVWELRGEPLTSRALRAACDDVSPTVLQARMKEMREAQLVELGPDGYALTELGKELRAAVAPLYSFSLKWAEAVRA